MRTRQYTFFLGSVGPYVFSMDVTLRAELIVAFPPIGGNNAALTDIAAYERNQLAR